MKSKSQQNLISTVCTISDYRKNGHVEEETGIVLSGNFQKQIYLDGDLAKRKYEDMTSSRIEHVEAGNDHEVLGKFSYFKEHKKRRPPKAGNLIQVQETTTTVQVEGVQGEEELQARSSESTRRSRSASGVEVTPEICGESDLTAENHMAEESSRSSNNDGSSMFESAAESVSKGPNTEFRSVSSLGIMHCSQDHTSGGRDVSVVTSGEGPSHMSSSQVKNDAHHNTRTEMKDLRDREDVLKSASYQLGSGSTEAPSSVTNNTVPSQIWGRSNQEWLQLGVGTSGRGSPASSNVQTEVASGEEGKSLTLGQGHEERAFFKRKMTTSINFPVGANCEANSNIFPEHPNAAPSDWQFRKVSTAIPPKLEVFSSDPSVNLNPATFRSVPISSLMRNAAPTSEVVDIEKSDLRIFGRRLIQTGTARQELVLAPLKCSGTRESDCSNASEKERAMVSIDDSFELRRDPGGFQGGMFPDRDERFSNAGPRGPEIHNLVGPLSLSTPITDVHLRSASAAAAGTSMDHDSFQCHRDNPPSSLSALQQRREDLRHGQVGYSWLPPPAADSAPKLVPTANNFQGWTSELNPNTKVAALSANNAPLDDPLDQQAMRACPDEWGNLFKKVSPLFQSQCHRPEGSSVLVESAGREANVGSQENLVALKRVIENIQKRPQWLLPPEAMNLSVQSWCLNGSLQGVRSDHSKLECFAGERMSSMLSSESGAVHSRFTGDRLNLSEKPSQRQSWQPVAGQAKLQYGNVNSIQRPVTETGGKPKFQVLPPGSRGTNHAGLWFVLQSAENQSDEGGLPQISKAYLRIKDGKMPVSAVKKYLVTKLGLTSESEVEITCKGQPVVPSLPLQHVRDVIWFSSLNGSSNKEQVTSSVEREEYTTSASEQRSRPPAATDRAAGGGIFSKDILMVLTYRRHPRSLQLSTLVT